MNFRRACRELLFYLASVPLAVAGFTVAITLLVPGA